MRVCAVDFKDNHANICLLHKENDVFDIPDCRQHRLTVHQVNDTEQLRDFQFAFKKLMEDYKVDRVVITERIANGKHAAKMSTFKLEAALQTCADLHVEIVPMTVEKQWLKHSPPPVEFKHTGLRPFQEKPFMTAYAYLSN